VKRKDRRRSEREPRRFDGTGPVFPDTGDRAAEVERRSSGS